MREHIISITWGKACNYIPGSVEEICWDGSLTLNGGIIVNADLLHVKHWQWTQAIEEPETLCSEAQTTCIQWKSAVVPGAAYTLEGLRVRVEGDTNTDIVLQFSHTQVQFRLGDLLEKELLRYHAGGKYSGSPIDIFLGPDARPRMSKQRFARQLLAEEQAGCLLTPDDFTDTQKEYYHCMYSAKINPGEKVCAQFSIENYAKRKEETCPVRLQITAPIGYEGAFEEETMSFGVEVGNWRQQITHVFTSRLFLPKLEEIYMYIPWSALREENNLLSVTHVSGKHSLLLHRVAFGAERKSMKERIASLPALPDVPQFYVGTDTNLQTPANGDVDVLIDQLINEQLGNYILFRERVAWAPEEDITRWATKAKAHHFMAATARGVPETERILENILGDHYLGEQAHEFSNLIYGWGEADPIAERKIRTLKECKQSYLNRMGPHRLVGQALPQHHLDYEAGVDVVMTEIPASHATLTLHAARGAANIYDKPLWGIHVCNHVTRAPLDQDHVRRLFILLEQCWLHGARILQDEEVAYRFNHDTIYSFSDELPSAFREVYQDIYHYANRITLGQPVVQTGFLQGNYDMLVGGVQAKHDVPRTKVWGQFGPETDCWEFDTPESGWKMIDPYMPGVWLYPVLQDRSKLRLFFTGSPNGQVDLVPITAPVEKLLQYPVLILPGWNTMTQEIYDNLCRYANGGGHLILCAAQCTEHVTRDFLKDKEDFAFIHNGDLSALAGVQVAMSDAVINEVCFDDETVSVNPGVRVLDTKLCGATVLATDRTGKPVIVEKKHDAGRVWLLCAGEFWGAEALDCLRESLCKRIVRENKQSVWLTGDTQDVDYYVFEQENCRRIVLLNTDWASAKNKKYVSVNTSALRMETSVTEGRAKHILVKDSIALSFEVPSAIIEDFAVNDSEIAFTVSGVGTVNIELFRSDCGTWENNTLQMEMGSTWSEQKVVIPIQKIN